MTILNTYEAYNGFTTIQIILACLAVLAMTFGIGLLSKSEGIIFSLIGSAVVVVCVILPLFLLYNSKQHPYTCYQVVFTDNAKVNDVLDKYKIIDQEGKIYTLTLKEE